MKNVVEQIERTTTTVYRWWNPSGLIPEKHTGELESFAEERIGEMRAEGVNKGHMFAEIDGATYCGWFETQNTKFERTNQKEK